LVNMFQQTLVLQQVNNTYEKYYSLIEELDEAIRKKVFRKGKFKRKLFCPTGQKADKTGKRCVIMKGKERQKRKRALMRGKVKRKGKMARIVRKRKRAMKRRKSMGLK
jgi:hypothetical protein